MYFCIRRCVPEDTHRSVEHDPRRPQDHCSRSRCFGSSHIVGQDDELRRPAVIMAAKCYDVDLSHSGRKIARKPGESKGGTVCPLRRPSDPKQHRDFHQTERRLTSHRSGDMAQARKKGGLKFLYIRTTEERRPDRVTESCRRRKSRADR